MHSLVKEILVYSNEGPNPFQSGDDTEITKIHWQYLLKSFPPEPFRWREVRFIHKKNYEESCPFPTREKNIDDKSFSPEPLGILQPNLT